MDNQLQNDVNSINQASGIITQAAGVISSVGEYESQRDWQKEMYKMALTDQRKDIEDAREYAEMMYNKYESIPAQYRQMLDAGINPNDAAQYVKGSQPSYQPAQSAPAVPQPAGVGLVPQSMANLAQVQLASAKQDAEIAQIKAETRGKEIDNEYKDKEHQLTISQAEALIEKNKAEVDKIVSDARLNEASTRQIYAVLPYTLALNDKQIDLLGEQISQAQEQVANLKAQRREIEQQIKTLKSSEAANYANAELAGQQKKTEAEKTKLAAKERDLQDNNYRMQLVRNHYESSLLEDGIDPQKISYDFAVGSDDFGHYNGNWGVLKLAIQKLKSK